MNINRFEDSPDLFGSGVGGSTCGGITCEICGTKYNEDDDDSNEYEGMWILNTVFAGKTVCECCFEHIENAVLQRMPDILTWYQRILEARRKKLESAEATMQAIQQIEQKGAGNENLL